MAQHIHSWQCEPPGVHADGVHGSCACGAMRVFSNGASEFNDADAAWEELPRGRMVRLTPRNARDYDDLHQAQLVQMESREREGYALRNARGY